MKRSSNTEPIPPPYQAAMVNTVQFHSNDNCPHQLQLFRTHHSPDTSPVILCFPAMGVHASHYTQLASHFNEQGFHFACTDLRGNGPQQKKPSWFNNFGYQEMLEQDWPASITEVKKHFPRSPIFLMGHSLGGQLSVCFSALNPNVIQGIILVAAGTSHYNAFHHKLRTYCASQLLSLMSYFTGYLSYKKQGLRVREARQLTRDYAYNVRTGRYRIKQANGYKSLDGYLTQMKTAILAFSFDGDRYTPHSSTVKLLDKLSRAKKTHIRTSALEMQTHSIDHFNWVQNGDKLVPSITKWIIQQGD